MAISLPSLLLFCEEDLWRAWAGEQKTLEKSHSTFFFLKKKTLLTRNRNVWKGIHFSTTETDVGLVPFIHGTVDYWLLRFIYYFIYYIYIPPFP